MSLKSDPAGIPPVIASYQSCRKHSYEKKMFAFIKSPSTIRRRNLLWLYWNNEFNI